MCLDNNIIRHKSRRKVQAPDAFASYENLPVYRMMIFLAYVAFPISISRK